MAARAASTASRRAAPHGRGCLPVPTFALYGEPVDAPGQDLLHIEEVQSRSRLHHWEIAGHVHQGLVQVVWLMRGAATVALDETRLRVDAPAAVVVPPGVVHGFRFAPETDGLVLTLSPRFLLEGESQASGPAFQALFSRPGVVPVDDADAAARLDALLRALAAEFAQPGATETPVVAWLARAAVWRLAELQARRQSAREAEEETGRTWRDPALYARFVLLVESHFLEHWTLERYASRMGLSTSRLNRLVRAETGQPALAVVHARLTREACRRLAYIAAPAASLAADLGFEDPSYFCRFFKRRTGLTPQRWRQQHRDAAR